MASNVSLGSDVIMETQFGPVYLPDDFDVPGDEGYYYPKTFQEKKQIGKNPL